MAITRREFVGTLGMLAAAVGMSQGDIAKVTEAFGHGGPWATPASWTTKPKVVWVHGAECTGCSTSLLSLFEDATGVAVPGLSLATGEPDTKTAQALAVVGGAGALGLGAAATALSAPTASHPSGHRTLNTNHLNVDGSAYAVNIADVLIDFIDLQYHETVMGMGGDGAYAYLKNEMTRTDSAPFVLVVEGAVQDFEGGGYWSKPGTAGTSAPWCSIAKDGTAGANTDLSFDDVVEKLATRDACKAVIAIGQCATYGGYPACIGPNLTPKASGTKSQTGAKGVSDFLIARGAMGGHAAATGAAGKVINVPGCPANPWWFVLTVVAWLVDAVTATPISNGVLGILDGNLKIVGGVDSSGRLTAVYGHLLHGQYCPRYPDYAASNYAAKPGDAGCLKNIGCKGLSTMSSCGRHGWNAQQPQNTALGLNTAVQNLAYLSTDNATKIGGCCLTAGAPCMGCTEKGYPDAFTPFVVR